MIFADCDVYNNRLKEFKRNVRYTNGYQSIKKISIDEVLGDRILRRWPWTCTALIRKDLYEHLIESDPYIHKNEIFLLGDVQLFAESATISELIYIPECLATYRVIDESASNTKDLRKYLLFWISLAEMELYLCDKHKVSENIRKKAELLLFDKSLSLAFHDRNYNLAVEIKKKIRFTWRDWIRYFGSKNIMVYHGYNILRLLKRGLKRKPDDWNV